MNVIMKVDKQHCSVLMSAFSTILQSIICEGFQFWALAFFSIPYLVWFDRCDLPSCWTALSALHGNSTVTWTRRHWLAARRSACNEMPVMDKSTQANIFGCVLYSAGVRFIVRSIFTCPFSAHTNAAIWLAELLVHNLTIRLSALELYEVMVASAFGPISYRLIEISSL